MKDAQRTKTDPQTTNVLVVLWGHRALAARVAAAAQWAGELLASAGARVAAVDCVAEALE